MRRRSICHRVHANQIASVVHVSGILTAQYIQNWFDLDIDDWPVVVVEESHWKKGIENKAAMKVLGRNITVIAATVVMAVDEESSSLLAEARVRESSATEMASSVSFCFMRLESCR